MKIRRIFIDLNGLDIIVREFPSEYGKNESNAITINKTLIRYFHSSHGNIGWGIEDQKTIIDFYNFNKIEIIKTYANLKDYVPLYEKDYYTVYVKKDARTLDVKRYEINERK